MSFRSKPIRHYIFLNYILSQGWLDVKYKTDDWTRHLTVEGMDTMK